MHIVFHHGGPWSFELFCLFSNVYTLFLELKSLSQRFQLEKCGASECIHFNIESDLLSVVKGIAGSVALSLTRVNWVSFSFSQQQYTDGGKKKKRKDSFIVSCKSLPSVHFDVFLLRHKQKKKQQLVVFFYETHSKRVHTLHHCWPFSKAYHSLLLLLHLIFLQETTNFTIIVFHKILVCHLGSLTVVFKTAPLSQLQSDNYIIKKGTYLGLQLRSLNISFPNPSSLFCKNKNDVW